MKFLKRGLLTVSLTLCALSAQSAPMFMAEALPLPGTNSTAHSVGNNGTIVGFYRETQYRAFSSQNGVTTTYPTMGFGGGYNKFIGVNNTNVATGRSFTSNYAFHALTYNIDTDVLTDIGTLGGTNSFGEAINDSGQVVGISETSSGQSHAFSYQGGVMTDLGTLGGSGSNGFGLNSSGVIVGDAQLAGNTVQHGFVYQNGVMTDLGALGGNSSAVAINDGGLIAGNAAVAGSQHAVLFGDSAIEDLGTLGGLTSEAFDINSQGWVVGSSLTSASENHAFLYAGEFGMLDLNDLLVNGGLEFQVLLGADSVNDFGQIVGTGIGTDGVTRAFSLTVSQVPLPAAGWFFLSSLTGLLGIKFKKQRLNR